MGFVLFTKESINGKLHLLYSENKNYAHDLLKVKNKDTKNMSSCHSETSQLNCFQSTDFNMTREYRSVHLMLTLSKTRTWIYQRRTGNPI